MSAPAVRVQKSSSLVRFRLLGLVLGSLALSGVFQPRGVTMMPRAVAQERPKAPELEGGGDWLNISKPLSLKQLKGKIVLLDFWTLC